MNNWSQSSLRRQSGLTLIESLVALVVITVGLAAILNLQFRSVQYSADSYRQTLAVIQANDLIERYWVAACFITGPSVRDNIITEWCADNDNNCPNIDAELINDHLEINFTINIDKIIADGAQSFEYASRIPIIECDEAE